MGRKREGLRFLPKKWIRNLWISYLYTGKGSTGGSINEKAAMKKIKPYKPEERQHYLKVWEDSVLATHHFLEPHVFQSIKKIVSDLDLGELESHGLWEDDELLGFIGIADKKIEMLFLSPRQRRKGYGRLLMEFALDIYAVNSLDVNEQNPEALGFYLHMGFEIQGRSEIDSLGLPYPILHLLRKNLD